MAWWQRPKIDTPMVRIARPTDRPALADLQARAVRLHGSQAVEEQVALLNTGVSTLAMAGDRPMGFLGLRLRTPSGNERWADLAMVALVPHWTIDAALQALVSASLPGLREHEVTGIVCLTGEGWLHSAAHEAGFRATDRVITYVRNNRPINGSIAGRAGATLRPAGPAEADTVLQLNAAAFAPLWRYDDATTLSWLMTADHAMLAEVDSQAVGFALTSRASSDGYAQLIRLGTHPEWQGQGIGRQLVVDTINYAHGTGALGVALNTQSSNAISRHLYETLGFRTVGPAVDVMVYGVE